jgi:dipeptidyl-peptidase-4
MDAAELRSETQGFARARGEGAADAPDASIRELRVEDVVLQPLPGYTAPVSFAFRCASLRGACRAQRVRCRVRALRLLLARNFTPRRCGSPDDALVSFLWSPEATLTRQLFAYDPATRRVASLLAPPPGGGVDEATLSHEEVLRRERARERGLGVTRYAWAKKAQRILVPDPAAGLLVQDSAGAPAVCAVPSAPGAPPLLDAQLSPDGAAVAFVRDGDLHVAPAAGGAPPLQLTRRREGEECVTHGLAEYIAQEEMLRADGFWWSPDSAAIAFCRVDDAPVARYRIPHWMADPAAEEQHAYPFAGTANACVRLGVVRVPSAAVVWLDLDCGGRASAHPDEEYLARVAWSADGAQVLAQVQDRTQRTLRVVAFDAATGARVRTLLTERGEPWVNLCDAWKPLADGSLVWSSERTGFRHLYRCDASGVVAALTSGDWAVDKLEGVDEARGVLYFTATLDSPLERHLYAAPLSAAGPPRKLTAGAGMHAVTLDHAFARFVDVHDAPGAPPRVTLRSLSDGAELACIWEPAAPPLRAARLGLVPPAPLTVTAADGTQLHGCVFKPDARRHGPGPWPLIVSVYGGPHVQTVTRSWALTVDMRAQLLRSRGFAVLKLDGRGSARRGLAFEASLHLRMGSTELEDQAAGVAALVAAGVADPARVGIYGWSYGGYLSALAALRMPAVFKAAVSGAPVTSWDGAPPAACLQPALALTRAAQATTRTTLSATWGCRSARRRRTPTPRRCGCRTQARPRRRRCCSSTACWTKTCTSGTLRASCPR